MDKRSPDATCHESADAEAVATYFPLLEETSTEYVAQWNHLVSTTNWEKGRIICEWRQALIEFNAPPEAISGFLSTVQDAEVFPDRESEAPQHEMGEPVAVDQGELVCGDRPTEPFLPLDSGPLLPPDLNKAFEEFRRAVLRHRLSGWQEVPLGDVLSLLDSLRELALATNDLG